MYYGDGLGCKVMVTVEKDVGEQPQKHNWEAILWSKMVMSQWQKQSHNKQSSKILSSTRVGFMCGFLND